MLQKFNITTYAVVLCLFGFMLFTAAPVFADPKGEFDDYEAMKWKGAKNAKKDCFMDLAAELLEVNENLRTASNNDASSSDGIGALCEKLEEYSNVGYAYCRISDGTLW